MNEHFPELQSLTLLDAQAALGELAAAAARDEARVVLTQDGEPVAALVSLRDLERVLEAQRKGQALIASQREFAAAFADVPVEEAEAEVDRIFRELRETDRAAQRLAATG